MIYDKKERKQLINELTMLHHRIAELEGLESKHKQVEHDLGERVKELKCLYGIASIFEQPDITLDEIYQEVVNLLPPSWQYPEVTCARMIVGEKEFKTNNFKMTSWRQAANIKINDKDKGTVEVYYFEERPDIYEGPFLKEERLLLDAVAERLGRITKYKRGEQALQNALEESQQRQMEISSLLAGSQAVLKHRQFKDTARIIFDSCKNIVRAGAGYIALLSKDGMENEVLFLESGGLPCVVDPSLSMPIRGLRAEVYKLREAVYENDFAISEWTRYLPIGHVRLDNVLFAPLIIEGQVIGLLGLANKPGGFTENDARLASAFGEFAAVALFNSRTLESLRHSEEQYHDMYEEAPSAYFSVGTDGYIKQANRRAMELFGYSREEMIGRPVFDLYADTPNGKAKAQEIFEKFCTGEEIQDEELEMRRVDGGKLWASLSVRPICDKEGRVVASRSWIMDITERKQAEEEINRLARFPSENPNPVMRVAQNGTILYANKASSILLSEWKCKVGQLLPEHWRKLISEVIDTGLMKNNEIECKNRIFSLSFAPVVEEGYTNVYGLDITERKQAEEAIRESRNYLQKLTDSMWDAVFSVKMPERVIEWANDSFKLTGYEPVECIGKTTEFLYPDRDGFLEFGNKLKGAMAAGKDILHTEQLLKRKGGEVFPAEITCTIIRSEKGEAVSITSIVRDISERKQLEEEINRLAKFPSENPSPVMRVAQNGTILYANKASSILLDEWKCKVGQLLPEHWRKLTSEVIDTGLMKNNEIECKNRIFSLSFAPVVEEGYTNVYGLDITERKHLDHLKDEFIGLVSHELRSPLTVITGAVGTVMTEGPRLSEEETHQLLLDASQEADSLSRLLNNLIELSRAQAGRLIIHAEPVNLKKVLRDSIESIRCQSSAHSFILELPDKLPAVHADQLRLERILYNLLENAVNYSPWGGDIRVSVKIEKEHLVISISDQGIGVSKTDKDKLFKPFQRIEDARLDSTRGLGLGLLVCQRLVESHGGKIWVESQPGCGSTFYFTLPLATH